MKTTNEYSQVYPEYRDTPKAVIAAVAYSLAVRIFGDEAAVRESLRDEWAVLHANGIVPQEPNTKPKNKGESK